MMSALWLNRAGQTVARSLAQWLTPGSSTYPPLVTLVAGYVSLHGLLRTEAELRAAIKHGSQVRLLLAVSYDEAIEITLPDPFTDTATALRRRLDRNIDYLRAELAQVPMTQDDQTLLLGLADILRQPRFHCRRHEKAFVHSKVFAQHGYRFTPLAVVGSANLTLGGMERNEECSVTLTGASAWKAAQYASAVWDEATDFDLAGLIEEQFACYPHELVFLRMLFELFGQDVNADDKLGLTAWQRDAVARALEIERQYGGALIADDVGVGKTYIAGEIIRRAVRDRDEQVLVVCPANLVPMWRRRLADWNLHADVLSYHMLVKEINAATTTSPYTFPYQVVVLDEAHWLRNHTTWRDALCTALTSVASSPPRVFSLTATPIQNRGHDLAEILTITLPLLPAQQRRELTELCRQANRLDEAQLATLHRRLESVMVRRTRRFIQDDYPEDTAKAELTFPHQIADKIVYHLPGPIRTLVRDVLATLDADNAGLPTRALHDFRNLAPDHPPPPPLTMAAYHPRDYQILHQADNPNLGGADWTRLTEFLLCKRLESSIAALASTLDAMYNRCIEVVTDLDNGVVGVPARCASGSAPDARWAWNHALDENTIAELEGDDVLTRQRGITKVARPANEFDIAQLRTDLIHDLDVLTRLKNTARELIPLDPKLPAIAECLTRIAAHEDGPKVVIFTGSRATGEHLTRFLEQQIKTNPKLAAYRGRFASLARSQPPSKKEIQRVTADFAPQAAHGMPGALRGHHPSNRHDLLVCTDMLAEGINLQQTAFVIHFDLPWNPMMIWQRSGRVDRLGSPYTNVNCWSVFPDRGLDAILRLLDRLYGKIDVAAAAVGVPNEILPGSRVQLRDFTSAVLTTDEPVDTFPAFDIEHYRVMLATALRTPILGEAIRNFPRKAGGLAGQRALRGFVFCFRMHTELHNKAVLCTVFTNGVTLVEQAQCLTEAAVDLRRWMATATHHPTKTVQPNGSMPATVFHELWPALKQARKLVARQHQIADTDSDDQITLITWLALHDRSAR